MKYSDRHNLGFWILFGVVISTPFLLMISISERVADEVFHIHQIGLFLEGEMRVSAAVTVIPTFHFVVATIAEFLQSSTDQSLRLISFAIAILVCPVYLDLVRHLHGSSRIARVRTLQLVLLPILLPLFFLVYTDTWSLLLVILGIHLCLGDRSYSSGLSSTKCFVA